MIAVAFFITQTQTGFKVVDDLNRNYGEFETKKQAEEKYSELSEKYY